ncbi:19cb35f4-b5d2-4163-bc93-467d4752de91-CDS [Sclerotinia trifoliorum]|uniref:19cb35f4-b5d2-4163-bc93-467d4752de91-CDS n=1 Tax=Sclerotinia trifoliorum TaxID=28548 RepID=A0A8H2W4C9_9HELO|nr:19cb35f4-b5d2-4163-bc93-467d4752de91-CDS [Sclerotinia trifoliorum]
MEGYMDRERFLASRKHYEELWRQKWNKERIAAVQELESWKKEEKKEGDRGYVDKYEHEHNLKHVGTWAHGEGEPRKVIANSGAVYDAGERIRQAGKRARDARLEEAWRVELEAWEEILIIYDLDDPGRAPDDVLTKRSRQNLDQHKKSCVPKMKTPARPRRARCDHCIEDLKEGISIE